ncbi:MAG TPA: hypothetical protein VKU19_36925 [Bryobacteraceae bacterium]|nr:hypothetical protein [Bryobacteraceae bacterium]
MPKLANGFDASITAEKAAQFGLAGIDIPYHRLGQLHASSPEEREAPLAGSMIPTGVWR